MVKLCYQTSLNFLEKVEFTIKSVRDALDGGYRLGHKGRFWFSELMSNLALRPNIVFDALESWGGEKDREQLEFIADAVRRLPAQSISKMSSLYLRLQMRLRCAVSIVRNASMVLYSLRQPVACDLGYPSSRCHRTF